MQVLVLHEAVAVDAPPEARDTLVQVEVVIAALRTLDHQVEAQAITLDLKALQAKLARRRPEIVFNLVESLGGSDAVAPAPVALLEAQGIACTGSPSATLALCNDKLRAKTLMRALALPTPPWATADEVEAVPGRYLVKAVAEHGSCGIDDEALFEASDAARLQAAVAQRALRLGRPCFAERYVDGREINVSLLEHHGALQCLPPAEIDFSAFAPGRPRLVGYAAKWREDTDEYRQTPRRFVFGPDDGALLRRLEQLARRACDAFGVRGYARVDFRVDAAGPWVLEVNTNPCLSPDAGFAAALAHARIDFADAIAAILAAALERS